MTTADLTLDQVNACAMKCISSGDIRLPKADGRMRADAVSEGNWIAWRAKSEEARRWWRAAKADLRGRQLRGGSYPGDVGHVTIGGRGFSFYPKSGMLIRDDFALWCDHHWEEVLWKDGRIREPERPAVPEEVRIDPLLHQWKDVRARCQRLPEPTLLMKPAEWNTLFDMKRTLSQYAAQIEADSRAKLFYPVAKCQADLLGALVAYREHRTSGAVDFLLDLAATAIRAGQWIQERAAAEGGTK